MFGSWASENYRMDKGKNEKKKKDPKDGDESNIYFIFIFQCNSK